MLLTHCVVKIEGGVAGLVFVIAAATEETYAIDPVSLDGVVRSHGVSGHYEVSVQVRLACRCGRPRIR